MGEGWWGVRTFTYFIALFRVLKHLNHFKAIKKYLITGLGLQPPLRRPPALTSAKSPSLTFFFFEAFPKEERGDSDSFPIYVIFSFGRHPLGTIQCFKPMFFFVFLAATAAQEAHLSVRGCVRPCVI